jgi:predicted amidohydrolase
MRDTLRVACAQLSAGAEKGANIATAERLVARAAAEGAEVPERPSYGHSLACDPWGTVLGELPDGEGVVVADLDRRRLLEVRKRLPSPANRQPAAYRKPTLA